MSNYSVALLYKSYGQDLNFKLPLTVTLTLTSTNHEQSNLHLCASNVTFWQSYDPDTIVETNEWRDKQDNSYISSLNLTWGEERGYQYRKCYEGGRDVAKAIWKIIIIWIHIDKLGRRLKIAAKQNKFTVHVQFLIPFRHKYINCLRISGQNNHGSI